MRGERGAVPIRPAPEDFVRRVTKRIAKVRKMRGMTQEDLAARLRTAVRNVQRIEAGQNLTLHTIARVAAALGVRPEELFVRRAK